MSEVRLNQQIYTPQAVRDNGFWFVFDGRPEGEVPFEDFANYFDMGEVPIALPGNTVHAHDLNHLHHYEELLASPVFSALVHTAADNSHGNRAKKAILSTSLDAIGDLIHYRTCLNAYKEGKYVNEAGFLFETAMLLVLAKGGLQLPYTARMSRRVLHHLGHPILADASDDDLRSMMAEEEAEFRKYKIIRDVVGDQLDLILSGRL